MAAMLVSTQNLIFFLSLLMQDLRSFPFPSPYLTLCLWGKMYSNLRSYCWKRERILPKARRSWWATSMPAQQWPMWCVPPWDLEVWTSSSMTIRVMSPFLMMALPLWSSSISFILLLRSSSTSLSRRTPRYFPALFVLLSRSCWFCSWSCCVRFTTLCLFWHRDSGMASSSVLDFCYVVSFTWYLHCSIWIDVLQINLSPRYGLSRICIFSSTNEKVWGF